MFDDGEPGSDGWGIYWSDEAGQSWKSAWASLWHLPGDVVDKAAEVAGNATASVTQTIHSVSGDVRDVIETVGTSGEKLTTGAASYLWGLSAAIIAAAAAFWIVA